MADTNNLTQFLTDVAGAIKEKTGKEEKIPASTFDEEIRNIQTKEDLDAALTEQDDIITNLQTKVESINKLLDKKAIDGSTNVPIKLFASKDEMERSTGNKEGDLALVYGSEINNWQADTQSNVMIFPQTVTLKEAFTDFADLRFRPVDESVMLEFMGNISPNNADIMIYGDELQVNIRYTSEDGITYTKTEGDESVELPCEVKYERVEQWNDVIGYFIQTGSSNFEGLYNWGTNIKTGDFKMLSLESVDISNKAFTAKFLDTLYNIDEFNDDVKSSTNYSWVLTDTNKLICPYVIDGSTYTDSCTMVYDSNTNAFRNNTFMANSQIHNIIPKDNKCYLAIYDLNTNEMTEASFACEIMTTDEYEIRIFPDITSTVGNIISLPIDFFCERKCAQCV